MELTSKTVLKKPTSFGLARKRVIDGIMFYHSLLVYYIIKISAKFQYQ